MFCLAAFLLACGGLGTHGFGYGRLEVRSLEVLQKLGSLVRHDKISISVEMLLVSLKSEMERPGDERGTVEVREKCCLQ